MLKSGSLSYFHYFSLITDHYFIYIVFRYQAPGTRIPYEKNNNRNRYINDKRKHKFNKTPTKEFASMHVDRNKRCKEDVSNKEKKCDK